MSKRTEMENYFNEEYNNVCKKLYSNYMIGLKKRLKQDGHGHLLLIKNNGTVERILCGYVKEIFVEYSDSIINIMDTIKEEFSVGFTDKFLYEFKNKNMKTIDGYMESIEKKIEEIIGHELSETSKSNLINISQNTKNDCINKMHKKNESIKRLLKKDGFLSRVKNITLESLINWIAPFLLGMLVGNFNNIIDFFKKIMSKVL